MGNVLADANRKTGKYFQVKMWKEKLLPAELKALNDYVNAVIEGDEYDNLTFNPDDDWDVFCAMELVESFLEGISEAAEKDDNDIHKRLATSWMLIRMIVTAHEVQRKFNEREYMGKNKRGN